MLLETILEAPETVRMSTFRTAFNIETNSHQRFPPISPLAQSCPSE
jgi:hypothetical protein